MDNDIIATTNLHSDIIINPNKEKMWCTIELPGVYELLMTLEGYPFKTIIPQFYYCPKYFEGLDFKKAQCTRFLTLCSFLKETIDKNTPKQ